MSDDRFDAFGLPSTPNVENPLFADPTPEELAAQPEIELEEEPAEEEATEEETPAEEEAVEEPAEEPAEDEAVEEAPEEEPAEEPEPTIEELIFGKYKDLEAAEKGYDNLRDLQRRTAERARGYEQENTVLTGHARQLEQALQQAIPVIQALEAKVREYEGGAPEAPAQLTPQQVDLMVQMRTQEQRQAWEQERRAAEDNAAREAAVMGFYETHPDITAGDEVDGQMYDVVQALNEAWAAKDTEVNIGDSDTLEIVLEATKSPELLRILQMRPEYIDTDEGMQLARLEAAMLKGDRPITQQTRKVPASQVGQRKLPVTESASTGGTPPAPVPDNEWTETLRANAAARRRDSGSPFFE